jgi:diaminopimelate decarboxylase
MIAERFSGCQTAEPSGKISVVHTTSAPGFSTDERLGLCCDGVPLAEIAAAAGTPAYVYSAPLIREAWTALDTAFDSVPHALHYALKANSTLAVLRVLRALGSRADANSVGEIEVALRAGFEPSDLVFTGVGKTPAELQRAVALGVRSINTESAGEIARLDTIAAAAGRRARVALRINPDIDVHSHPHITTGRRGNKFGVPIGEARELYREVARRPWLQPVGIHVHLGSQITDLDPLTRAAGALVELVADLGRDGIALEHLDMGGGLGISYDGSPVPGPGDYAAAILPLVRRVGLELLLEPGRAVVGAAGVLLARVVDIKGGGDGPTFVVLDAGMTELLRPAMYGAYHAIDVVSPRPGTHRRYEVVGPLCESSDTMGKDRELPPLEVGDLVAVRDAGAYGSAMSSTYNRRPLSAEVMVDAGTWRVVRRRQTVDDMMALEFDSL